MKSLKPIGIGRCEDPGGVPTEHGQLFCFLWGGRDQDVLDLFAHLPDLKLQAFAHGWFDRCIRPQSAVLEAPCPT